MRSALFRLAYRFKRHNVLNYYDEFTKSQWYEYEDLVNKANSQLRKIINFAYEYVPYYKSLFDSLGISPKDVISIKDLQYIPILTKDIIKKSFESFIPKNINFLKFINDSTGVPLKYRMSLEDYERGIALLYRGWGYAGYELGDKVAVMAGSSLIPKFKTDFIKKRLIFS